jgi:general secretion pathway protein I
MVRLVKIKLLAIGMKTNKFEMSKQQTGFTLLEVMVALVVVAIGLGALLVATSQNIRAYQQLKDHVVQQWVDLQASNLLQLQQIKPKPSLPISQSTTFLGLKCYWQVSVQPTEMNNIYNTYIQSKIKNVGPWTHHNITYTFIPDKNESQI